MKKATGNFLLVMIFVVMVIGNRLVRTRIEGVETSPVLNAMRGMEKTDVKEAEKGNLLSGFLTAWKTQGGKEFSFEEKNGTITITGYKGKDSEVHIPDEIKGKKVTVFGDGRLGVFRDVKQPVTSLYFEDGIESLSLESFALRESLTSVHFPEKMDKLSIKDYLFDGMPLEEVAFPGGELEIGNSAFENCQELKSLSFGAGDGPVTIGGKAFSNTPIRELTLPEGETEIGKEAFYHTEKLRKVVIPKCNEIGQQAFYGCTSLESVTLGEGAEEAAIGDQAFGNTRIRELTIPGNITELGHEVFFQSETIEKVVWMPVSFEGVPQYMTLETFPYRRKLDIYLAESAVIKSGGSLARDYAKKNITIHAPAGSAVISYAKENGIPCVEENWYTSQ